MTELFSRGGLLTGLALFGSTAGAQTRQSIPVYRAQVVNTYPHDPAAFTEGLVFENGALFESTGLQGQSELRQVDLESGNVLRRQVLPPEMFGEGLTLWRGQVVQLTWTTKVGYVYDQASFTRLRTFNLSTEGWGLTHNGKSLIRSDGSNKLYFLNPVTFATERSVSVTAGGQPVDNLNELEYVNGAVLANVWLTNRIARIDPGSGKVTAWYDLSELAASVPRGGSDDVLNGIAYDRATGRLFVTGKRWPSLFEIKLGDAP